MNSIFKADEIEITSVFFSRNDDKVRFASYPRRINYKGREYILVDA